MNKTHFEWDEAKNKLNQVKHDVSFEFAQYAFADHHRIIVEDEKHSSEENRFYCIGKVNDEILMVRFTYRNKLIRIFGAGHWKKGKKIYEEQNKI